MARGPKTGRDRRRQLRRGHADARPEWSEVVAGKWLSSRLEAIRSLELRSDIDSDTGFSAALRPYQKLGVQWLWTLRSLELGGCLADDMGLDKTVQVLAILSLRRHRQEHGTDLLPAPASIVDNWRQEIERFAPTLKVLIARPSLSPTAQLTRLSRRQVESYDAVITTCGTAARSDWLKGFPWRSVILDEAQAIKNPGAKQSRAVKALESK